MKFCRAVFKSVLPTSRPGSEGGWDRCGHQRLVHVTRHADLPGPVPCRCHRLHPRGTVHHSLQLSSCVTGRVFVAGMFACVQKIWTSKYILYRQSFSKFQWRVLLWCYSRKCSILYMYLQANWFSVQQNTVFCVGAISGVCVLHQEVWLWSRHRVRRWDTTSQGQM